MEFRNPNPQELITKCTAIETHDYDGHNYCIHEDDEELFSKVLEWSSKNDEYETFGNMFDAYMVGGCYNSYRKTLK